MSKFLSLRDFGAGSDDLLIAQGDMAIIQEEHVNANETAPVVNELIVDLAQTQGS